MAPRCSTIHTFLLITNECVACITVHAIVAITGYWLISKACLRPRASNIVWFACVGAPSDPLSLEVDTEDRDHRPTRRRELRLPPTLEPQASGKGIPWNFSARWSGQRVFKVPLPFWPFLTIHERAAQTTSQAMATSLRPALPTTRISLPPKPDRNAPRNDTLQGRGKQGKQARPSAEGRSRLFDGARFHWASCELFAQGASGTEWRITFKS